MGKPEIRLLTTPKPLNRSLPKVAHVIMYWISTHTQNLITKGVSFTVCVKLCTKKCLLGFFFRVLPTRHRRGPRTDFHAKYVKRRGSAQVCAFSELENKILTFKPLFPKKTGFGWPLSPGHVTQRMRITNFAIKMVHWHCFHPLLSKGLS